MAKIIGNTTTTPMPVADWNQTDEKKADYIKNKPDFDGLETEVNDMAQEITEMDNRVESLEGWHDNFIEATEDDIKALFQ